MKNTKIAEIERLIEKYKERLSVIKSKGYNSQWLPDDCEIENNVLETVIQDLEDIIN